MFVRYDLMMKSDAICPECGAGFRRLEFASQPGEKGEYRCPACDALVEMLPGDRLVVYRLTVQPSIKSLTA